MDLHLYDGRHALVRSSGARRQRTVVTSMTRGYGPECVHLTRPRFPIELQAKLVRRGPMGHMLGAAHIVHRQRDGRLAQQVRPFVAMKEQGHVPLGKLDRPRSPLAIAVPRP